MKYLLSFISLFLLVDHYNLLAQDDVQVFLQRTIQSPDEVRQHIQLFELDGDGNVLEQSGTRPKGVVIGESVIELKTWYGTQDTFAQAFIYEPEAYKDKLMRDVSRSATPNLMQDIPWRGPYTRENVVSAFNYGRSQENIQLGNAPSLMEETTSEGNDFSLFLANDDRVSRGILPFDGIEANVQDIAEGHRDDMIANNFFGHHGTDGRSPFARIDHHPKLGKGVGPRGEDCHDFIPRAENLAAFWTSGNSISLSRARSQYTWVYDDASSAWGHRETSLLSDKDLRGRKGFTNDYGSMDSEGMVGFAVGGSDSYNPYNFSWARYGEVVVFNEIDPVSGCAYDLLDGSPIIRFQANVQKDKKIALQLELKISEEVEAGYFEVQNNSGQWVTLTQIDVKKTAHSFLSPTMAPGTHSVRVRLTNATDPNLYLSVREVTIEEEIADTPNADRDPGSLNARIESGSLVIDTRIPLILVFVDAWGRSSTADYKPGDSYPLDGLSRGIYLLVLRDAETGENLRTYRLFIH